MSENKEFGHKCWSAPGVHMDAWGSGPFVIEVEGKKFHFEDTDRFGPFLVSKTERVLERQPGERSPFWRAYSAWRKQGRHASDDGVACVYTPLRRERLRVVGAEIFVVEQGDEGGETLIEGLTRGTPRRLRQARRP